MPGSIAWPWAAPTLSSVKKALLFLLRWTYVLAVAFSAAYLLLHVVERTNWFKNHLYRSLLTGNADQQLRAATTLARVGGERQLLLALKMENEFIHDLARRALEHLWFTSAGDEAYELMQSAYKAAEKEDFKQALGILERLIAKYPKYAEGWNRRAAVYWQMGKYKEAMADCERALALNPNHFGAWQGLGVCQLKLGDLSEACRALRAALNIAPHDPATHQSLQKCEELLRMYPPADKKTKAGDLI